MTTIEERGRTRNAPRQRSRRATVAAAATAASFAAFGALCSCSPPSAPPAGRLETGRLGHVHLQRPQGSPRGLVYLFSGAHGWGAQESAAAAALQAKGAMVVGVDLAAYRRALDANDGECLYLLSEIEELGRQLEREMSFEHYLSPILAGIGEGATLAIAAVAQSPPAAVAGAVAVDPAVALRTRLPLCEGATAHPSDEGYVYTTPGPLPGFVSVGFTAAADEKGREHLLGAQADGLRIERDEASSVAPGTTAAGMLSELASSYLATSGGDGRDAARPRHLVELRSPLVGAPLVVIVSGDRGWRDPDRRIATTLNERGWNVLGWDSLHYFWRAKSPEQLASDLDAAIVHYTTAWHAPAVALVGHAFGADVLPFAYNRLPQSSRQLVRQVSLIGLSETAEFEIRVAGFLGVGSRTQYTVAAEVARMPPDRLQCFYGQGEEETGCPGLEAAGVEVVQRHRGNRFDGGPEGIAGKIVAGLARRGATLPEPAPPEAPAAADAATPRPSS